MTLHVRNAVEADIPRLGAIEKEFSDNVWTESQLKEELNLSHAHLFCCEVNGELAGFCDLHIVADDAHVNEICVAPQHRRLGCAHALMHHAIGLCRELGCASLTLEVRSKNEPAVLLYEKCGFRPCGLRKYFYHDPQDDAVTMLLRFRPES